MLLKVVKDLVGDEQSISGMLLNTKILVCSGDLNNRLFGQWSFRTLNLAAPRIQEFTTNEPIDVVVVEALSLVLKLAEYLAKLPKISLTNTMDQLPEKVPDLLVRQGIHDFLTIHQKDLNTPSGYLKRYTTPIDIVLDSEMAWPMQTKLFPLS
ncbi:unnamed protein product [Porites lobata]|uniref:Uncharacterized protein n=1 Tax=Porites lobata TaxID=104759 RepID=A0ABN8Q830_9CNID|nr:unnamed protein product [Porites lobata]